MVLVIFLTKNYSTKCMERKKSEHIQGRTNRRRLDLYPKIHLPLSICIQNMIFLCYTVVEISLTKNIERKKRTNTGKNKEVKAHSQSHDTTCHFQPIYQI